MVSWLNVKWTCKWKTSQKGTLCEVPKMFHLYRFYCSMMLTVFNGFRICFLTCRFYKSDLSYNPAARSKLTDFTVKFLFYTPLQGWLFNVYTIIIIQLDVSSYEYLSTQYTITDDWWPNIFTECGKLQVSGWQNNCSCHVYSKPPPPHLNRSGDRDQLLGVFVKPRYTWQWQFMV